MKAGKLREQVRSASGGSLIPGLSSPGSVGLLQILQMGAELQEFKPVANSRQVVVFSRPPDEDVKSCRFA